MAKKRILLVDDEKAVRILVAAALEYDNYKVDIAENGAEAIQYLDKHLYDLVITDYMMPEMDGLELIRIIKSKYPPIPVVVITGTESAYYLLHGEAAAFIAKPFDLFDLKDCIKNVLKQSNHFS